MAVGGKKKRPGLLKRPSTITNKGIVPKSLKPQQARGLIRRFHVLQKNKYAIIKRLKKAEGLAEITVDNYLEVLSTGKRERSYYENAQNKFRLESTDQLPVVKIDEKLTTRQLIEQLAEIDAETTARGGIGAYQSASTQGQNSKRGGDSSKKLVEWLKQPQYKDRLNDVNALEIGCLSTRNVISTCNIFKNIVRIDLNSQSPLIVEQDFMQRPLPTSDDERFNLISCSLVINFVPSPKERGDMLVRMTKFLKKPVKGSISSLFLVLPLPCITNSRYFDNELLQNIMKELGFKQIFAYEAKKVAYWLFDWSGQVSKKKKKFTKKELYSGSKRNNFCITIGE
ncbi:YBZ1-like protein [Scheffersomyces xylosifermentans]|uniref:YBZ1-like protein n=1 Tax=Scheffersomyces xylosifermentans TaxID=1304137 RepID=UPI00315DE960